MKTLNEKIAEARKKMEPVRQSFQLVFNSPSGEEFFDCLQRCFLDESIPKDNTGAVDPNMILIQHGRNEVIEFIRRMKELNEGQGE